MVRVPTDRSALEVSEIGSGEPVHLERSPQLRDAKNRLCPPHPYPNTALDWLRTFAGSMAADDARSTQLQTTAVSPQMSSR